jgi:hypothetical protein
MRDVLHLVDVIYSRRLGVAIICQVYLNFVAAVLHRFDLQFFSLFSSLVHRDGGTNTFRAPPPSQGGDRSTRQEIVSVAMAPVGNMIVA